MKKRISLTIDSELLKHADKFIDNLNFDSRSSFIEECIKKYLQNSNVAVILAGGNPDKLKLNGQFKFLIPVKQDKTLLDLLFERLSEFGKIFIVGQKEVINTCFEYLSEKYSDIDIEYIEEKEELGNAKTLELVRDKLPQNFLVLPIDQYYDLDFLELMKRHNMNQTILKSLVTLTVVPTSTTKKYGNISMIGSRIVKHEEKKTGKKTLISAFAAVCDKQIFDYIPKGKIEWGLQKEVYPKLIEKMAMSGYILNTPIFNIHSEKDIKRLRRYLKNR